jgi:uncharacterized protein YkwD
MLRHPAFVLVAAGLLAAGLASSASASERQGPFSLPPPLAGYPTQPWLEEAPAPHGAGPSFAEQVLALVNQERLNNGSLPPLKGEALLDLSSSTHSTNMGVRNFFSHCDLDTFTMPWDRMTAVGYAWISAAENIAAGYSTPQIVMNAWMASSGHRANILSTSYREIGVGYYHDSADAANVRYNPDPGDCVANLFNQGPYVHYWTQNFGSRNNVYPVVIDREAYETPDRNVDLYLYGGGFATEMRLRNEAGAWSAWMPFNANVAWQLSAGAGTKTVNAQIRNAAMTVLSASDTIHLAGASAVVFQDGFESGNLSAWSGSVP